MINIGGDEHSASYRYKIPHLIVKVEKGDIKNLNYLPREIAHMISTFIPSTIQEIYLKNKS